MHAPHRLPHLLGPAVAALMAGCGALPHAVPAPSEAQVPHPEALGTAQRHRTSAPSETRMQVILSFQNPRTSFSSDKIDLLTGKTLPLDDGMGPEGDISFFYDGSHFQVIANAGGGANRSLARAESGQASGEFAMAPLLLAQGSEVLVKHAHGTATLRITELKAGSMRFLPTGTGTGTGSVTFDYRMTGK